MKFTEDIQTTVRDSSGRVMSQYTSKGQFSPGNAMGSFAGIIAYIAIAIAMSVLALFFFPLWFIANQSLSRLNIIKIGFHTDSRTFSSFLESLNILKSFKSFHKSVKIKTYLFNTFYIIFFIVLTFLYMALGLENIWIAALFGALLSVQIFALIYLLIARKTDIQINTLTKLVNLKEKKWVLVLAKIMLLAYVSLIPLSIDFIKQFNVVGTSVVNATLATQKALETYDYDSAEAIVELHAIGLITIETPFKETKYRTDTMLDYLLDLYDDTYMGFDDWKYEMLFTELITNNTLVDFNEDSLEKIQSDKKYKKIAELRKKHKDTLISMYRETSINPEHFINSLSVSLGIFIFLLLFYKKTLLESYQNRKLDT